MWGARKYISSVKTKIREGGKKLRKLIPCPHMPSSSGATEHAPKVDLVEAMFPDPATSMLHDLHRVYGDKLQPGNMRGASYDGMKASVITSWLQKAIRRGRVDEALFCASLKVAFCTDKDASHFTNLCNRLEIICVEDIGLACPYLFDMVVDKLQTLQKSMKGTRFMVKSFHVCTEHMRAITGIVRALCKCPKNRNMSHLRAVCDSNASRQWNAIDFPSIPEEFTHVLRLSKVEVLKCLPSLGQETLQWFKRSDRQNKSEWELAALLITIRSKLFDKATQRMMKKEAFCMVESELYCDVCIPSACKLDGEMKSIVMDIHTGSKRKTADTMRDFAIQGAFVANEKIVLPHHEELKRGYIESKSAGTIFSGLTNDTANVAVKRPSLNKQSGDAKSIQFSDVLEPIPLHTSVLNFKKPIYIIGSRVYKFDHVGRMHFAMRCEQVRKLLEMEVTNSVLHPRVLFNSMDLQNLVFPKPGWQLTYNMHVSALKGEASVMVSDVFEGLKLSDVDVTFDVDIWSLAQVMIFRRSVGCTDTNASNILISSLSGRALSIDENYSKPQTLTHVFTAQKMSSKTVQALYKVGQDEAAKIVDFAKLILEKARPIMPELDVTWLQSIIANPLLAFTT